MKKHNLKFVVALLTVMMLLVTACGGGGTTTPADQSGKTTDSATNDQTKTEGKKLTVGYYINGTLGDKSFYDSAQRGLEQAKTELGIEFKTVEGGLNQADWASGVESMIGKYDVIIAGSSQMIEMVQELAAANPDQKFIFFDDAAKGPNIYSMTYNQYEGSFLAGAFAGLVTTNTELKATTPEKVVGFIGGMDIPIINDFKAGFEKGAQYVDPAVKVVSSFIGDFMSAPKGKELALAQFNTQKVDIIYGAAGAAGAGGLEAGKETGKYTIGVDSNQNGIYPGSILTSMLKNIDTSLFRALKLWTEDQLQFGTVEQLGVKEGGVGLAKDELYEKHVPQSIKDKMIEIEDKVTSGEIELKSTLQ